MDQEVIEVPSVGEVVFHLRPIGGHQGGRVVRYAIAGMTFTDGSELSPEQERAAQAFRAGR